jgi:hypothetical protein
VTGFTLVGEGINDTLNPLIRERPINPPEIPERSAADLPPARPGEPPATATAATSTETRRE